MAFIIVSYALIVEVAELTRSGFCDRIPCSVAGITGFSHVTFSLGAQRRWGQRNEYLHVAECRWNGTVSAFCGLRRCGVGQLSANWRQEVSPAVVLRSCRPAGPGRSLPRTRETSDSCGVGAAWCWFSARPLSGASAARQPTGCQVCPDLCDPLFLVGDRSLLHHVANCSGELAWNIRADSKPPSADAAVGEFLHF